MPRPIWTGTIGFGLVSVPIHLMVAVREKSVQLHLLTPDGTCRLRRKLVCPETGKEFDFRETARGVEIAPDQYVVLDEKEVRDLKPEAGRDLEIRQFVRAGEVDPIYFNRTYYVTPAEGGGRAYGLLVEAMAASQRQAIGEFVLREKQHIALLRPVNRLLVLHTLFYHDEVVPTDELAPRSTKTPTKELEMAKQLVATLDSRFRPEGFKDTFRAKLTKMVSSRSKRAKTIETDDTPPPRVLNIMDALKQSLAHRKAEPAARRRPSRKSA
ncbi:MAG: Ku protein [Phycisphaerae bacterium]|jgi:DNA end-binding protein Ku|nr:Ku protein [Phycisphaerae bacterium]